MVKRSINTQNVAWFVDLINRGLVDLDPPYQRRSVWTKQYKRFFIDTIMRNYPSPPIFLSLRIENDGTTRYGVVDGKQRLESILQFVKGEIAIPPDAGDIRLNGKYFAELSDDDKKRFWSYLISVENLQDTTEEEINQSFDRLNRNVLKLTPQELRHAKFDGKFIRLVTEVAEDPFWQDVCISTRTTVRRMRDVEFVSELFLLTMKGIQTSGKDTLDQAYVDYDEEIPDEEQNRRRFEKIKEIVKNLDLDICSTRLKNFSDFYTLWSVLREVFDREIRIKETRSAILGFLKKLEEVKLAVNGKELQPNDKKFADYLRAVASQPNEARNRRLRKDIFTELIKIDDNPS